MNDEFKYMLSIYEIDLIISSLSNATSGFDLDYEDRGPAIKLLGKLQWLRG